MNKRSRYLLTVAALLLGLFGLMTQMSLAQSPGNSQNSQSAAVFFENVRIFDGVADTLTAPSNVLVIGNSIRAIDTRPLPPPADIRVTRISGEGRVLMPGLIDNHIHLFMVRWYTPAEVLRMATSTNASLLALSEPRNPYPDKLGMVAWQICC